MQQFAMPLRQFAAVSVTASTVNDLQADSQQPWHGGVLGCSRSTGIAVAFGQPVDPTAALAGQ
jgi:hypothetical protein